MTRAPILAYVAHSLPAETWERRAALCRELGLALEIGHGRGGEVERALELALPIVTLQAYGLHQGHALSARPEAALAGFAHLVETIELAGRAGVPRVLAVCGFGHEAVQDPFERSLAFFRRAVDCAREARVRIVIELLGKRRASAMTEPADLARLIAALDVPDVFSTAVDTGHLLDAGRDPAAILAAWTPPLEELQLRGPDDSAPGDREPVEGWLASLEDLPPVVCIEHHEKLSEAALLALVARVRHALGQHPTSA